MARSTEFPRSGAAAGTRTVTAGQPAVAYGRTDDPIEESQTTARPRGRSYDEDGDWRQAGTLGLGLAIGLLLGAGIALITAPRSGEDTRARIGERARSFGGLAADRWDDLRDEMRWAARRGRRGVRRGMTRGRWAAEDLADRGRNREW
ncbi:MAG: hypothetical protein M3373_07715 [Gemmatimonadota bacterium]|nr:hypothetical protein [Gemmatimonadota bacterium]